MIREWMSILKNRSILTGTFLVLGMVLVVLFQDDLRWLFDKNDDYGGMSYEAFWSQKKYAHHDAEVVILGDSQAGVGISPAAIQSQLPDGMRVYNFAFGGGGLTPFIYEKAEETALTQRKDKPRVVVIGVTPLSLSSHPMAADDEHYHQIEYVSPLATLLEPISLEDVLRNVSGNDWKPAKTLLYNNGWFPFNEEGSPEKHFDSRIRLFTRHHLMPERVDALMTQVRKWSDEGIIVVGLKLPVYEKVEVIERELIGFDTDQFVEEFREQGGHWYEVPRGEYKRYNCCHLHISSTEGVSKGLGAFIAEAIRTHESGEVKTCNSDQSSEGRM